MRGEEKAARRNREKTFQLKKRTLDAREARGRGRAKEVGERKNLIGGAGEVGSWATKKEGNSGRKR